MMTAAVLDPDRLLDALSGDVEAVRGVVELFATQRADLVAQLRDAIGRAALADVHHVAHSLKGALATLGADAAAEAALRLERSGRAGDLATVAPAFAALERELERLQPELDRLAAAA
jgi:HPt (histidine-containing phosphotransfer) domain-containing protein